MDRNEAPQNMRDAMTMGSAGPQERVQACNRFWQLWDQASNLEKFVEAAMQDPVVWDQDGTALAVAMADCQRLGWMRIYMDKVASHGVSYATDSDVGGVKFTGGGMEVVVGNGMGDGKTVLIILDGQDVHDGALRMLSPVCTVGGTVGIQGYDCNEAGHEPRAVLQGRYGVYAGYGYVVLRRWG